jgi:hypothetical protein
MGQLFSRRKPRGIPVYVSVNSRIVQTHELFPLKAIMPQFNELYSLTYLRYIPSEPAHISVKYPGMIITNRIANFDAGLILDHEKTYKEGTTLNITFRPRPRTGFRSSSYVDSFDWYPDLSCIIIKLLI